VTHEAITLQSEHLVRLLFCNKLTFDSESLLGYLFALFVLVAFLLVSIFFLIKVSVHFDAALLG